MREADRCAGHVRAMHRMCATPELRNIGTAKRRTTVGIPISQGCGSGRLFQERLGRAVDYSSMTALEPPSMKRAISQLAVLVKPCPCGRPDS